MSAVSGPYAKAILEGELGAPAGTRGQRRAAGGLRRPPPRSESGERRRPDRAHGRRRRARLRRRLRRRRRPQHDRRPQLRGHAVRQPGAARRARRGGAALPRRPGRHRALDADLDRRRPRRQGARHRLLRDADRLEVLRQPARCRPGDACAARRATAPAPTTCARRTACGRCCSGSTSWPRTGESVESLVRAHWARFGRNYYSRHDYEAVDSAAADALMTRAARAAAGAAGPAAGRPARRARRRLRLHRPGRRLGHAASRACGIVFDDGSRIVFRLSGTGTEGATLRVYLETLRARLGAPRRCRRRPRWRR